MDKDSPQSRLAAECGFEAWDRLDGLYPTRRKAWPAYNEYLRQKGYDGPNPWHAWANSAEGADGEILSGWLMENANKPARVAEEDSETPYSTSRAIEFMEQAGDQPWCLHLSYIKPHWPYIVPAPYHDMYGPEDVVPVVRSDAEKSDPHPVYGAFQQSRVSTCFSRDEVRARVVRAYMGLITQIDDQVGRLMTYMEETGRDKDTMIVFTSDHGDYLGDHWLGEKELFHDASARVPLIVVDPDAAADGTRGTKDSRLIEAIDLLPTFVDWMGGTPRDEILEGRSLMPLIRGEATQWRGYVFSEYDYAQRAWRARLGTRIKDSRLIMVFDGRWKMIHAAGFRPMLYDLEADPDELTDLGNDPAYAAECARLKDVIFEWATQHHNRVTVSDAQVEADTSMEQRAGIVIGFWDEAELAEGDALGVSGN